MKIERLPLFCWEFAEALNLPPKILGRAAGGGNAAEEKESLVDTNYQGMSYFQTPFHRILPSMVRLQIQSLLEITYKKTYLLLHNAVRATRLYTFPYEW